MTTEAQTRAASAAKVAAFFAALAKLAPSIALSVLWERDTDAHWDIDDPELDADDFTAWQSTVTASAIVAGKLVEGHAYLAGTWERYGDKPRESNPEISGYLWQNVGEALDELSKQTKDAGDDLTRQIDGARSYVKDFLRRDYEAQRAEIEKRA